MRILGILGLTVVISAPFAAFGPARALGQWLGEAPNPSAPASVPIDRVEDIPQVTNTDRREPVPAFGVGADLVGIFFGRYAVRFEGAPTRHHSIWFAPSWSEVLARRSLGFELGYHLWPMGDGLDGLFVGPSVALALAGNAAPHAIVGGGEAGYQWFLGGVTLTAVGGVTYAYALDDGARNEWEGRVQAMVGYAWM
ncbi:MAG: hypothetical protein R3A78_15440 [Polyangiales bacterium]|nr:hypothetical protein [Myxococcales bacterium]